MDNSGQNGNGMLLILVFGVITILVTTVYVNSISSNYQINSRNKQLLVAQNSNNSQIQDVYVKALSSFTYDNPNPIVKANEPVRFHFSADGNVGCGDALIMQNFGVSLVSQNSNEQVAEFTPPVGTYQFSCPMGMIRGTLTAK